MSAVVAALQEAWETGNPVAPLPAGAVEDGAAAAAALAEAMGHPVIGLRLARGPQGGGWLSAPMIEPRMLRAGTPVALAALRQPVLSVAVLGVLAEELGEESDGPPVFSALHPALDVAATRFRDGPADAAQCVADLGGLGFVLVGKRSASTDLPETAEARLGRTGTRPRAINEQLAALMRRAADEARRWGGLPAGSVLVVSGLGGEFSPLAGEKWSAAVAGVGRINAGFG